jgi:hypothetical protein
MKELQFKNEERRLGDRQPFLEKVNTEQAHNL